MIHPPKPTCKSCSWRLENMCVLYNKHLPHLTGTCPDHRETEGQ